MDSVSLHDGSMLTLPNNEDIKKEFCTNNVVNQYKDKSKTIVQARVSVLYDVLNNISLDSIITNSFTIFLYPNSVINSFCI
jgi:hypothetical protein